MPIDHTMYKKGTRVTLEGVPCKIVSIRQNGKITLREQGGMKRKFTVNARDLTAGDSHVAATEQS